MDKCPCEECILLAICKARQRIECELLYDYVQAYLASYILYAKKVRIPLARILNKRVLAVGPKYNLTLKELK